jgi:uncharacterized protein
MTEAIAPLFNIRVEDGPEEPGTASDFELNFSRRALAKLKARLGQQGVIDLLTPDIEQGNAYFRDCAQRSNGEWTAATITLRIQGVTTARFIEWFHDNLPDQPAMLAAQPEHFVMTSGANGTSVVVENLGPHICHFTIQFTGEDEAVGELLPDYPIRMVGHSFLEDGTVIGRVLHQFGDIDGGFAARLEIYFPSACSNELIDQHRQHLLVEFTNWVTAAGNASST